MISVELTDELQRLLRKGVEDGLFASEESAVEEALKAYFIERHDQAHPKTIPVTEPESRRLPGPFIEDETISAPGDLPRSGQPVTCRFSHDLTRQPDRFPGE